MSADEIDRVHSIAVQMQGLAGDIDDLPTGAFFVDPDAIETLTFLRESCEAAERAVDRILGTQALGP